MEIGVPTPTARWVCIYPCQSVFICGSFKSLVGAKGTVMNQMQCSDKPISYSKWAS